MHFTYDIAGKYAASDTAMVTGGAAAALALRVAQCTHEKLPTDYLSGSASVPG